MEPINIFGLQFAMSLIVFALIARWYAAPWLAEKPAAIALTILILPHAFRHIGLSFLLPNLNSGAMPDFFAGTAGYGDRPFRRHLVHPDLPGALAAGDPCDDFRPAFQKEPSP
jgi:hypothetical protein